MAPSGSLSTDDFSSMLVKNPQPCYFISIQEDENRVAGDVGKLLNYPVNVP